MICNDDLNVNRLFEILESKYKLKQIALSELNEYFPEYSEGASLYEVSEGYLQDSDTIRIYIGDASSENGFLPIMSRKYDMYILHYDNDKLASGFYRSKFGENREIINLIETFVCN